MIITGVAIVVSLAVMAMVDGRSLLTSGTVGQWTVYLGLAVVSFGIIAVQSVRFHPLNPLHGLAVVLAPLARWLLL